MSAPTLSMSVIVLSLSTGACWTPRRLARVAGRGLLVRKVSPTGAPKPNCCCVPLGAMLKGEQVGPGRQSEPLRLGTVTAGCQPIAGRGGDSSGAAGGTCSLGLWSCDGLPGDRSRRVRTLTPRLGLCVRP